MFVAAATHDYGVVRRESTAVHTPFHTIDDFRVASGKRPKPDSAVATTAHDKPWRRGMVEDTSGDTFLVAVKYRLLHFLFLTQTGQI